VGPAASARIKPRNSNAITSVAAENRHAGSWHALSRDFRILTTKQRPRGHPYKETVDQASLTSTFDLKVARENSPSFDKFYRDVASLLGTQ
jgi:hypothetical protein